MNVVLNVDLEQKEKIGEYLTAASREKRSVSGGTQYRLDGSIVTLYTSGKLLIQGQNASSWQDDLSRFAASGRTKDQEETYNTWPQVGTDESGKGDFFGPLVTAAFLLRTKEVELLLAELGVRDSKQLSDARVIALSSQIKELGTYEIVKIGPQKYNQLYESMKNVNRILAWSHARSIENALQNNDCELVIADQFGDESLIVKALFERGRKIRLVQRHKAEAFPSVAAASILARATFLESMKSMSQRIGFKLPLGAGRNVIETGTAIAKTLGMDIFGEISKTHFKTFQEIKDALGR